MKIKVQTNVKIELINLRALRKKAGLTLVQLAKKTGIKFPYLSNIETGKAGKIVQFETWKKIKKAINIDKKKNN